MKEQKYIVTLDITISETKTELAQLLGTKSENLSRMKQAKEVIYCIESDCEAEQPIGEHVRSILEKVKNEGPIRATGAIKSMYLNIGVLYYTFTCSAFFPHECLNLLLAKFPEADIAVSCYPCCDEEGELKPLAF
jgi:hypothetical protein